MIQIAKGILLLLDYKDYRLIHCCKWHDKEIRVSCSYWLINSAFDEGRRMWGLNWKKCLLYCTTTKLIFSPFFILSPTWMMMFFCVFFLQESLLTDKGWKESHQWMMDLEMVIATSLAMTLTIWTRKIRSTARSIKVLTSGKRSEVLFLHSVLDTWPFYIMILA